MPSNAASVSNSETSRVMSQRFSLGIDLGTTNSAVAITDLETDRTDIVDITQILGASRISEKPDLALGSVHPGRVPGERIPAALA